MVNITKKYLEEKLKAEIWDKFLKEIRQIKSESDLRNLCEKLFTPSEIIMIEKRLGIRHLLAKGLRYREIGEILDVMPKTISFTKKGFKKYPKIKRKEDKLRKKSAEESFLHKKNSIMPTYVGKGRWRI
ncbi:hypothetical protein HZB05_01465 [Candidatus Wolfebacteria bacterium]|nr:hypothetical protein [Candidatus Wolfebacteria bacterium]